MYIEHDIPDLSEISAGFPQYWLKLIFISSTSNRYQINALASTFVRLVEAALIEYQAGSQKLREFWGTHDSINLSAMHRSMSHFETCFSNIYRATNCFRRLRGDRWQDPLSIELKLKKALFASDSVADQFRLIRNEIHHLEEMVMEGKIIEGQPFALHPNGIEVAHPTEVNQTIKTIDRLVIGTREVRFVELAAWLSEMSQFANLIADFVPSSRPAGDSNAS